MLPERAVRYQCAHDVPALMGTAGRLGPASGEADDRTLLGAFLRWVSVGHVHSRCACSHRVQVGLTSSHYEEREGNNSTSFTLRGWGFQKHVNEKKEGLKERRIS